MKMKINNIWLKNKIKAILLFLLILAGLYIYKNISIGGGCDPPEKPKTVPTNAIWYGDCDGGYWVELVKMQKDTVRFRIYNDWNGELLWDADFVYKECNNFRLPKSNWKDYILISANEIYIFDNDEIKCTLIPKHTYYNLAKTY